MHELSLLPPHRRLILKRALLLGAAVRFVNSVFFGTLVLTGGGIVLIVALWSTTMTVKTMDSEGTVSLQRFGELRSVIGRRNALLTTLDRVDTKRVVWSALIRDLLAIVPPGTTITTIAADATDKRILLTGTAPARSTLIAFEERLRLLSWVSGVEAPRENLLLPDNPPFRFSLTIDPTGRGPDGGGAGR